MFSVIVTVYIEAASEQKREELLQVIDRIIDHAHKEQGVLRFVVGLPIDDSEKREIYLIEEYASESVRQSHLASDPVKVLLSHLAPSSPFINSPPEIHVLTPSISYQRKGLSGYEHASLLILAFFGYQSGQTSKALQGWKGIVENCEADKPPVLAYTVMEDANSNSIRTVEVYSDAEFASTTHLKSEAVKFNQEQNGGDRDGRKGVAKLKPVAGFLGRTES